MKMKRVLSLLLALVMSLAMASSAFAQEVPVDKTSPTATADKGPEDIPAPDDSEGPEVNEGEGTGIEPHSSYLVVDEPVSQGGSRWEQPAGYSSYRVWVQNTSNVPMKVTVKYSNGKYSHEVRVGANEAKTVLTVNNAVAGLHTVSFVTDDGVGSGIVRVRVSDVAL